MQRNLLKAGIVFLFFAHLIASQRANAQSTIQGQIIDLNKTGISQATVMLLHAGDSSLIKAIISDKDGAFVFKNIPNGTYLVAADFIGYKRTYSEDVHIDNINTTINV